MPEPRPLASAARSVLVAALVLVALGLLRKQLIARNRARYGPPPLSEANDSVTAPGRPAPP